MKKIKEFLVKELDKLFPNYFKLGNDCLLNQEFAKAIQYYNVALKTHANNPYLYYNWAACLFSLGKLEETIPKFQQAIELKPDFSDVYCSWGITLINLKNIAGALKIFEEGLKHCPDNVKLLLNSAYILEQQQQFEQAKEAYKKIIELSQVTTLPGGVIASPLQV